LFFDDFIGNSFMFNFRKSKDAATSLLEPVAA